MSGEIKRLEVFGAGTWNSSNKGKITVTEADLDSIVQSFGALQGTNIVKPHLKLGHTDAQKWFGQENGIPVLGWIDRVWREGTKLFADISNVPSALLSLIKAGRYHNVSAEVFPPGVIEHNGTKYGHVLSAVALLGTEMPAVTDLAGLASALFASKFTSVVEDKPDVYQSQKDDPRMFTQEQVDSLISVAVNKAVTDATGKLTADLAAASAQITTLTQRAEGAETLLRKQADEYAAREHTALIDKAISEGKLLPAQKDMALAFMSGIKGTINFGGAEKSAAAMFSEFIGLMGKQVDLNEKGGGAQAQDFATPAAEVDYLTKQAVKASGNKVNYRDAMQGVLEGNPELAARYAQGV